MKDRTLKNSLNSQRQVTNIQSQTLNNVWCSLLCAGGLSIPSSYPQIVLKTCKMRGGIQELKKRRYFPGFAAGVSNPRPRMAMNAAQHKSINLLKVLWDFVLFCFWWLHVAMYLMCGPRQLFFFQCGPEMPKVWTPLLWRDVFSLCGNFFFFNMYRQATMISKSQHINDSKILSPTHKRNYINY